MNVKEASASFHIPESTIRKLCKENKIPGVRKEKGTGYIIPGNTKMIITDQVAKAFLWQLLRYKNNNGIVLCVASWDTPEKLEMIRSHLIKQNWVGNCKPSDSLPALLNEMQITDEGWKFLLGEKTFAKAQISLNPSIPINIGLVNVNLG